MLGGVGFVCVFSADDAGGDLVVDDCLVILAHDVDCEFLREVWVRFDGEEMSGGGTYDDVIRVEFEGF